MTMQDMIAAMVIAVIGSNALFAFIQFMITRHDTAKNVKGKLTVLEKDVLRTQLLLMILIRPEEEKEILTIAQHYFDDLKGNWYMTSIFDKWLTENDYGKPEWFKGQS